MNVYSYIKCKGFIRLLQVNLNIHRPVDHPSTQKHRENECLEVKTGEWWGLGVGCEKAMSISLHNFLFYF
jgi:hypothetical protein